MSIKLTRDRFPRVADTMSGVVAVVESDATAKTARDILGDLKVSGAPVVRGEAVVGVISQTDLLRADDDAPVASLMSEDVYAVRPSDSALVAARVMVAQDIHRVIVVDEAGTLFGVLTALDALRAITEGLAAEEIELTAIDKAP